MSTLSLKQTTFAPFQRRRKKIQKHPTFWVGVGLNGIIYHSMGGEHWVEAKPCTHHGRAKFEKVCSGNGQFVAVGNRISVSQTGRVWTTSIYFTDTVLRDVAFGNGTWVCVGKKGACLSSFDHGKSWTHQQKSRTLNYSATTFGNGIFIAAGGTQAGTGFLTISRDGVTWQQTFTTPTPLSTVVFGNGYFVAMDTQGVPHVSKDGIHWQRADIALGTDIGELQYVNGSFLVRSDAHAYHWSIDGLDWIEESGYLPHNVVYGGAKYLALSEEGSILSASVIDTWSLQTGAILRFASLVHQTGDARIS